MASQDDLTLLKEMYGRGEISDEQYDVLRRHVLWGTPLPQLIDEVPGAPGVHAPEESAPGVSPLRVSAQPPAPRAAIRPPVQARPPVQGRPPVPAPRAAPRPAPIPAPYGASGSYQPDDPLTAPWQPDTGFVRSGERSGGSLPGPDRVRTAYDPGLPPARPARSEPGGRPGTGPADGTSRPGPGPTAPPPAHRPADYRPDGSVEDRPDDPVARSYRPEDGPSRYRPDASAAGAHRPDDRPAVYGPEDPGVGVYRPEYPRTGGYRPEDGARGLAAHRPDTAGTGVYRAENGTGKYRLDDPGTPAYGPEDGGRGATAYRPEDGGRGATAYRPEDGGRGATAYRPEDQGVGSGVSSSAYPLDAPADGEGGRRRRREPARGPSRRAVADVPDRPRPRRRRGRGIAAAVTSLLLALALVAAGVWWFALRETGVDAPAYARSVCGSVRDWQRGVDASSSALVKSIPREDDRSAVRSAVQKYYSDLAARTDGLRTAVVEAGAVDVPGGRAYADSLAAVIGGQSGTLRDLSTRAGRLDVDAAAAFQTSLQTLLTGAETAVSRITAALARPSSGTPAQLRLALSAEPACAPYVG